jgi:hypothetical protein
MCFDWPETTCLLAGSSRILRANNVCEVSVAELVADGEWPLVWSLDERGLRNLTKPSHVTSRPLPVVTRGDPDAQKQTTQRETGCNGWSALNWTYPDSTHATPLIPQSQSN